MSHENRRKIDGVCLFYHTRDTDGGYWAVNDNAYNDKKDQWTAEGLHYLRTGDYLVIRDNDNFDTILWEGEIILHDVEPYTVSINGQYVHSLPVFSVQDVHEWGLFFLQEHPVTYYAKVH